MIFIYLSLIFILIGLCFWIAGAILHKKADLLDKINRKKQKERALRLGTVAKILLIVAMFFFVMGFMMIKGVKLDSQ
ncbi:MAG: hypothetical protein MUE70_13475 [Desulfobacterales bacterium]|nr:hypothetical protein [Desulfobacterales bacterium]